MEDGGVQAEVTLEDLVSEMGDLDHLTRMPDPPYRTLQASSWDRRSVDPADDAGWYANRDNAQFDGEVRVGGRRELVMLEAEGAGALVRFWSAAPLGTIRIYIDDFAEPAIEADMETFMNGTHELFGAPFSYVSARGRNLYFPIPFSERVRVTTDEGDGADAAALYYHVGYRLYDAGVDVERFSATAYDAARPSIDAAAAALMDPDSTVMGSSEVLTLPAAVDAPDAAGGVIRRLELRTSATDAELRSSVLVLTFDDEETVRAPVGDFFGTGPGANDLSTFVLGATTSGVFVSRFPMPFARRATIAIEGPATAEVEVMVDAWEFDPASMHFHAGWGSLGAVEAHPHRDFDLAQLTGAGTYVGTHLMVVNPINEWWGEGDEKIYVDGDAFPTWFGTGTEDYFGYAYTDLELFSAPYHAQSRSGVTTQRGHISNLRVHVLDPIVYQSGIDFDMELWAWVSSEIAFHWVSYWYSRGGTDEFAPLAPGDAQIIDPDTLRR